MDGIEGGTVCPHNVYAHNEDIFANRENVYPAVDRLFRLVNSADLGLLVESELDPITVTELIASKAELNRQNDERREEAHARAAEAESNKNRGPEFHFLEQPSE